jgi:hypothetical protein
MRMVTVCGQTYELVLVIFYFQMVNVERLFDPRTILLKIAARTATLPSVGWQRMESGLEWTKRSPRAIKAADGVRPGPESQSSHARVRVLLESVDSNDVDTASAVA